MVLIDVFKTQSSQATQRLRNIDQQKKLTISSRCIPRPLKVNLSLHLKGHTNLMATRINIATVDEGGESDCDAVPQLLLVDPSPTSLLYLVSRLPATLPLSMLEDPP